MYKYLLFDLDGTLTDSAEGITKSVQYAMHYMGFEEENLERLRFFVGPPLVPAFMEYCGWDEDTANKAVVKYRERYSTVGLFENSVYEGIPEVLEKLMPQKALGRKLVVASSKPETFCRTILDHFGILSYFDDVVGASMDGKISKKADVIAEVFRRFDITEDDKKDVLMIGDREHDVLGAKEVGVDCLGVYFGFANPGELEEAGAKYIVNTVKEMGELLLKI